MILRIISSTPNFAKFFFFFCLHVFVATYMHLPLKTVISKVLCHWHLITTFFYQFAEISLLFKQIFKISLLVHFSCSFFLHKDQTYVFSIISYVILFNYTRDQVDVLCSCYIFIRLYSVVSRNRTVSIVTATSTSNTHILIWNLTWRIHSFVPFAFRT